MKKGLIGYMFQNQPRNKIEEFWWKIKSIFGWKNISGVPIIVCDKVEEDKTIVLYQNDKTNKYGFTIFQEEGWKRNVLL